MPFALIHGESLVACASWALGAAEITAIDLGTEWGQVVESGAAFVVHDSLCPLTPPAFLAACVDRAVIEDRVVVGTRPVTDTVKAVLRGVGGTVDRSSLVLVASPVVLPPRVVAALDGLPDSGAGDLVGLVAALGERFEVVPIQAPPGGRRVFSLDDVRLLEALGALDAR